MPNNRWSLCADRALRCSMQTAWNIWTAHRDMALPTSGTHTRKLRRRSIKQASTLITLFESFPNDQRAMLMEKITSLVAGLDRVFFCNSGTEAVEAAFKFARISTGRKNIVAAMRAFHGRTYGSLSATFNKKYREGFEPLVPGFQPCGVQQYRSAG